MKPAYLIELEDELREQGLALNTVTDLARTAVLVADGLGRRLIESASAQLGLSVTIFDMDPGMEDLEGFEMIVADEALARTLRQTMTARDQQREGMNPALVAVRQADAEQAARNLSAEGQAEGEHGETSDEAAHFDGVLTLPTTPAALSAQLSLILYSHRAFARRYQTALEELHLNRRIFRSVTSGISVANASLPDLPLVYVNPAFEVMTGYSLEDVQGKNCRFLQGPQTDQAEVTKLREAIQDGREVVVILKNFRKDGTAFWNEFSLSPIRSRDGQLTHFVGIQTDVTARVEFEAALRESEKLAAVGRLASSIAHEINNPLESVMNLLYLAQHEAEPAEVQRYVAQADKELKRVALITSQSLRFYKQSSRPQEVTGTDLLESVLDLYEGRAANAGLVLERRERAVRSLVGLDSELRQGAEQFGKEWVGRNDRQERNATHSHTRRNRLEDCPERHCVYRGR